MPGRHRRPDRGRDGGPHRRRGRRPDDLRHVQIGRSGHDDRRAGLMGEDRRPIWPLAARGRPRSGNMTRAEEIAEFLTRHEVDSCRPRLTNLLSQLPRRNPIGSAVACLTAQLAESRKRSSAGSWPSSSSWFLCILWAGVLHPADPALSGGGRRYRRSRGGMGEVMSMFSSARRRGPGAGDQDARGDAAADGPRRARSPRWGGEAPSPDGRDEQRAEAGAATSSSASSSPSASPW